MIGLDGLDGWIYHRPLLHLEHRSIERCYIYLKAMDEVDRIKNMARVEVIHPVKGHRFAIAVKINFKKIYF